jgi:hypothetical protein
MQRMPRRDRSILVSIVATILVVSGSAVIVGTSCLGRHHGQLAAEPPTAAAPASDRTSAGGPPSSEQSSTTTVTAAEVTTPRAADAEPVAGAPIPAPAAPVTTAPPAAPPPGNAQHVPTALVPRTPLVMPLDAADGGHVTPPPAATTGTVDASVAVPTADAAVTSPVETPRRWLTEPPSWGASHMEQNPEAGAGPFQTEWPRWPR